MACFAAQQGAEKGIKALFLKAGQEPAHWQPTESLVNAARELDKHYIPLRYPNSYPEGHLMNITREAKPKELSPIRKKSLNSVRVFWLDQEQVKRCLTEAMQRVAKDHPEVEEIWLFGSLARGEALPGSDADLFVVLSNSSLPLLDRTVHYHPANCGIGVDILAYTRDELRKMEAGGHALPRIVFVEGICLYKSHP